jgi:hypothetical protein
MAELARSRHRRACSRQSACLAVNFWSILKHLAARLANSREGPKQAVLVTLAIYAMTFNADHPRNAGHPRDDATHVGIDGILNLTHWRICHTGRTSGKKEHPGYGALPERRRRGSRTVGGTSPHKFFYAFGISEPARSRGGPFTSKFFVESRVPDGTSRNHCLRM